MRFEDDMPSDSPRSLVVAIHRDNQGVMDRLDEIASEMGMTRNALVNLVLRQFCDGYSVEEQLGVASGMLLRAG